MNRKRIEAALDALLAWSTNPRLTRIRDPEHKGAFDCGHMLVSRKLCGSS